MNIRYPLYEGVYRILTLSVLSFFIASLSFSPSGDLVCAETVVCVG